jgi:hypothetical protein
MSAANESEIRLHARLSASASHRWLHCPPSVSLEQYMPDKGSVYASEGSLAHSIAELCLRKYFELIKPSKYKADLKKLQEHELYQPEMLAHVETYFDYIAQVVHNYPTMPHAVVEKRVDYGHIAPEGFGTADCIVIGGATLHVIDFKYGQGVPVSGERNTQMMLYALGALRQYQMLFAVDTVKMAVVQPRLNSISEDTLTVQELTAWGESIKETAQAAWEGKGAYNPGDWCRFCRAGALCRTRMDPYTGQVMTDPVLMSDWEVGAALKKAKELQKWASALADYALAEALNGREIHGWKLVEGRSVRKWINEEKALKTLIESGIDESKLYETKPLSLAGIEKVLTKGVFGELVGNQITKEPGKPTLVEDDDPRPLFTQASAESDFKEIAERYQAAQDPQARMQLVDNHLALEQAIEIGGVL